MEQEVDSLDIGEVEDAVAVVGLQRAVLYIARGVLHRLGRCRRDNLSAALHERERKLHQIPGPGKSPACRS